MIFFSRKPKPSALPPGWPSPYHNKCSQRDCLFPNNPQIAKGVYQCRGVPGGFFCEGTYKISSSRAQESEHYLKEMAMRRKIEEEQRMRTASDARRPDLGARRRDMVTTNYNVVPDNRPRVGYSQAPRASRPNDVRRPQASQGRRPSYTGHRPSQSQIEQEYMTDQILMQLYPGEIRPRWI